MSFRHSQQVSTDTVYTSQETARVNTLPYPTHRCQGAKQPAAEQREVSVVYLHRRGAVGLGQRGPLRDAVVVNVRHKACHTAIWSAPGTQVLVGMLS